MSQWIPTSDRLPPIGIYVLCHRQPGNWIDSSDQVGVNMLVAKRVPAPVGGNDRLPYQWDTFGPSRFFGHEITHWAPLPGAPEGGEV